MAASRGQRVSQKVSLGFRRRQLGVCRFVVAFGVHCAPVASFHVCVSEDEMCRARSLVEPQIPFSFDSGVSMGGR